jgi:hypothetical protein
MRPIFQIVILLALLTTSTTWMSLNTSTWANETEAAPPQEQKTVPTIQELEQGIAARLKRVEEFKFIEEEATQLGVRAYLFGGTAAGYAHYVKWDMQREKGDPRFQKDRFDYDYTNIYRSTQDLDIVIDGNAEQANKLQQSLQEKYPHLQGGKTAWEVRLLTQDMGDKQAILNNPDFMNQHTDSNSTGMIEITKPHAGENVVRDVRDWNSKEPYFLKDVHDGMLHYYFSPLHETTKFAKEGRNPPILSAIRFLTKAFQYELKIRPEDLANIKKIIQEFDPNQAAKNEYVSKWIEKNGKKLIQNAVNIEYAKNTLDQLGLQKKLQSIKGDINTTDSLAWWMNKEPLRTQQIGQGTGKTAKELGLDLVAHETNNFLAYESITRAHTGDPNVLISRNGAQGEAAAYGDGFYTRIGRLGARGTGLTIRFHLDPGARENADFIRAGEFVVIRNKAAFKVIPESLDISSVEFFRMLTTGSQLDTSDRGILEKLRRRISNKANRLSSTEVDEMGKLVEDELRKEKPNYLAMNEFWFSHTFSTRRPDLAHALARSQKAFGHTSDAGITLSLMGYDHWHRTLRERLQEFHSALRKDVEAADIDFKLLKPWLKSSEDMEFKKSLSAKSLLQLIVLQNAESYGEADPEILTRLTSWLAPKIDKLPSEDRTFLNGAIEQNAILKKAANSNPTWFSAQLFESVSRVTDGFNSGTVLGDLLKKNPQWLTTSDVSHVIRALDRLTWESPSKEIIQILSQPGWETQPNTSRLIRKLATNYRSGLPLVSLLKTPHYLNHPRWGEWVNEVISHDITSTYNHLIVRNLLSTKQAAQSPFRDSFLEWTVRAAKKDINISFWVRDDVLTQPHWKEVLKDVCRDRPINFECIKEWAAQRQASAGLCIQNALASKLASPQ